MNNTWRSISAVCMGAVATMVSACDRSMEQDNPVMMSPEQPEQTIVQPIDDSKIFSSPMPTVNMPPVTEEQRSRAKPKGPPELEEGYQGEEKAPSN